MAATALIDDDGFRYEALELEPEVVDVPDNDDDIATIIRGVMRSAPGSNRVGDAANVPENGAQVPRPHTETLPSVADDFIRNFLIRSGMNRWATSRAPYSLVVARRRHLAPQRCNTSTSFTLAISRSQDA